MVLQVTSLRLDPSYILWYKNAATFGLTLLLPLVLLAYWNTQTYRIMNRWARSTFVTRERP